ncbi:MAG: superoxide dismutase family protein [Gemmatimonadota bacterium]
MSRTLLSTIGLISLIGAAACNRAAVIPNDGAIRAKAFLLDTLGREIGSVKLTEKPGASGVDLEIEVSRGATPGQHGIHFHAIGSCVPAQMFAAAGGHFNPAGKKHGLLVPDGPHAGDLEAITVDYMGKSHFEVRTSRVTLSPGPNSLLDADGSAIVLHALPDDQRTDPSGATGNRIACGVIVKI